MLCSIMVRSSPLYLYPAPLFSAGFEPPLWVGLGPAAEGGFAAAAGLGTAGGGTIALVMKLFTSSAKVGPFGIMYPAASLWWY